MFAAAHQVVATCQSCSPESAEHAPGDEAAAQREAASGQIGLESRQRAGYLSARRFNPVRVLRLWVDYAALVGTVGLAAVWLPGAF